MILNGHFFDDRNDDSRLFNSWGITKPFELPFFIDSFVAF